MRPTKLIRKSGGELLMVYEAYCGEMNLEGGAVRDHIAIVRDDKVSDVVDCIQNWSEPYGDDPLATRAAWFSQGGFVECTSQDLGRMHNLPVGEIIAANP